MTVRESRSGRRNLSQATSSDAISSGSSGLLQGLEHPENVLSSASRLASSVFPDAVDLNAPAAVSAAIFLEEQARSALEIANQPRPIEAISTADYVRHTTFKTNSKCVIRIVPSGSMGKVRDASGVERSVKDASLFFDKFSLQSTVEDDTERYQFFEGMEGETLFLFNRKPRVWTFPGVVLNGTRPTIPPSLQAPGQESVKKRYIERLNMDFADELMRKYEQFYRGTQALKLRMHAYISYENVIIECTLLSMTAMRNQAIPGAVGISLTVAVHDRSWMGDGLTLTEDETLTALIATAEQRQFLGNAVPPESVVAAPVSIDQLSARSRENSTEVLEAQEKVASLEGQVDAANEAANAAQARFNTAEENFNLRAQKEAEIEEDIAAGGGNFTEADLEQVRQEQTELASTMDTESSNIDEAKAVLSARLEELDEAQKEADSAVAAQAATEESLRHHPDGDGTSSLVNEDYQATLTTTEDGHRVYTIYRDPETGEVFSQEDVTGTPLGEMPDFTENGTRATVSS